MKRLNILLCLLAFILCFSTNTSHAVPAPAHAPVPVPKFWCVAKSPAPEEKLQGFIDYACGKNDCRAIKPGGDCYEPNTLINHASYALNLDYRNTKTCDFDIAVGTDKDPSYGACHYV